jgi:site-specific recombinase XerD
MYVQDLIWPPIAGVLCSTMDANELHLAAYRRALQARNRSGRTIQNYEEALLQLADFHGGMDLFDLAPSDIEQYMADLLDRLTASTAGVRFRALRAFYNWAALEEYVDRSPMARMKEPSATDTPVPVLPDEQLRALLKACSGKDFDDRRDTAIIRLFCEPGSPRVSEMAGILLDGGLDMKRDQVRLHGKGDKIRDIPFGPKTGQALDRYLQVRRRHRLAVLPQLWLGARGKPLTASGIGQMLERRGEQAGIGHIHPHQLRHTAAHVWHDQGGSEADAMALFGWSSPDMPRRYGASARVDRAQRAARRTTMADRL